MIFNGHNQLNQTYNKERMWLNELFSIKIRYEWIFYKKKLMCLCMYNQRYKLSKGNN